MEIVDKDHVKRAVKFITLRYFIGDFYDSDIFFNCPFFFTRENNNTFYRIILSFLLRFVTFP